MTIAALGLLLVGCGGAPAPPASEPVAAGEVLVETPPPAPPLPACPFALESLRAAGTRISYVLPPSSAAYLDVWLSSAEARAIEWRYELRDLDGLEVGIVRHVCGPVGLALASTGGDAGEMSFDPPVTVLPVDAQRGEGGGAATLRTPSGVRLYRYHHAWDAAPAAIPDRFADGDGTGRSVHSALLLEPLDGGPQLRVVSNTVWVIEDDFVFAAHRVQEVSDDHAVLRERTEEARRVRAPSGD